MVIDYMHDVQPVWNRHCVRCHGGAPGAGKRKPLIHSILLNYGFADVLQPRQAGSHASRLPEYLESMGTVP